MTYLARVSYIVWVWGIMERIGLLEATSVMAWWFLIKQWAVTPIPQRMLRASVHDLVVCL